MNVCVCACVCVCVCVCQVHLLTTMGIFLSPQPLLTYYNYVMGMVCWWESSNWFCWWPSYNEIKILILIFSLLVSSKVCVCVCVYHDENKINGTYILCIYIIC